MNAVVQFPRTAAETGPVMGVVHAVLHQTTGQVVEVRKHSQVTLWAERMTGTRARTRQQVIRCEPPAPRNDVLVRYHQILERTAADAEALSAVAQSAASIADLVRKIEPVTGSFLDPSLHLSDKASEAKSQLEGFIPDVERKNQLVGDVRGLTLEQRRTLHASYQALIEAARLAVNGLGATIAALEFHDNAAMHDDERQWSDLREAVIATHGDGAADFYDSLKNAEGAEEFSMSYFSQLLDHKP